MLGRVAWDSRPGRTELGLERLGGMTLARATVHVPPGLGRFRFRARLRRARRFFEQNGVRRIILPESGENSWFSGFGRVDALPFYRAVADLLAGRLAYDPDTVCSHHHEGDGAHQCGGHGEGEGHSCGHSHGAGGQGCAGHQG